MGIIILGIIVLSAGFFLGKVDSPLKTYTGIIRVAGIVIVLIGTVFSAVYQIEPGEVGVQKLFGKVNNRTLESGLNIINPLVEVVIFDIRTQNYTMSGVNDEGDKASDDAIRVLSADGLEVVIDLTDRKSVV